MTADLDAMTLAAYLDDPMAGAIYVIRNTRSGRVYVGSSVQPKRRFYLHRRDLEAGEHHSPRLQATWNKHGPEAFEFKVIEVVPRDQMVQREQHWIDHYGSRTLNCAPAAGSPLGVKRTPEQVAAMAAIKKALYATPEGRAHIEAMHAKNRGRKQSPEERAMRSKALKGKAGNGAWSEDRRRRHSLALTGRSMPPVSAETRAKLSVAAKGRPVHQNMLAGCQAWRRAWIDAERPRWLQLLSEGKSFREIEKLTGRCRQMIARECARP